MTNKDIQEIKESLKYLISLVIRDYEDESEESEGSLELPVPKLVEQGIQQQHLSKLNLYIG